MQPTIPLSVIQDLCEVVPGFAERVIVRKVHRAPSTPQQSTVRKGLVMPFASILRGSMGRDIGTPAPAIPKAPAPTTTPTDAVLARANAGAGITRQASNTPKTPLPSKHEPVTYASLQAAIDAAMSKQRDEAKAAAFNESRSAFARLAPTRKSDVAGGGAGNAHGLRAMGGRLAATLLNSTTRKSDADNLPTNTAFRPFSASLKG